MDSSNSPRRFHDPELKARVLVACTRPGASVAAVALAHGLNANLVHKWRRRQRDAQAPSLSPAVTTARQPSGLDEQAADAAPAFVAVQLQASAEPVADIRLELQRGTAKAIITWPLQQAGACGAWLREWLR